MGTDTLFEFTARGAYTMGQPKAPPALRCKQKLAVTAVGMVSAVGACARDTFGAAQARVTRVAERGDIYNCLPSDPDFELREPAVLSAISYLGHEPTRESDPDGWLALLAAHALAELALDSRLGDALGPKAGLYVALPAPRDDFGAGRVGRLLNSVVRDAGTGSFRRIRVALGGRATAIGLLAEAHEAMARHRVESAVILGVDSCLRASWLEELDRAYKIKSERSFDGFVPSEAAACVLIEPTAKALARRARVLAEVHVVAHEKVVGPDADSTGEALARVIAACLPSGNAPLHIVTDLNGTTGKAREWGFVEGRLAGRVSDATLDYPVVSLGDIGAASGAAWLLLASMGLAAPHAHHTHALVFAASESEGSFGDGMRAAALLASPVTTVDFAQP